MVDIEQTQLDTRMPPQLRNCHKKGQNQAIKGKKFGTQYIFHYMYI